MHPESNPAHFRSQALFKMPARSLPILLYLIARAKGEPDANGYLLVDNGSPVPIHRIASEVSKTVRSVESNLRELESAGLVVRQPIPGKANVYRVRRLQ